jgi:tRNA(adenine34) deaminase
MNLTDGGPCRPLHSLNMNAAAWMDEALALAAEAASEGEVPVGAVIVDAAGTVIGRGRNRRQSGNPLGHAELFAIGEASEGFGDWRLNGTTMVVTLEPCAMCAGAIVNARIDRLIFGAFDAKAGFCGSLGNLVQDPRLNHRVELVAGFEEERCRSVLQQFFTRLRLEKATERDPGAAGS